MGQHGRPRAAQRALREGGRAKARQAAGAFGKPIESTSLFSEGTVHSPLVQPMALKLVGRSAIIQRQLS